PGRRDRRRRVAGGGPAGQHPHADHARFHDLRDGEDPGEGALTRPWPCRTEKGEAAGVVRPRLRGTPSQAPPRSGGVRSNFIALKDPSPWDVLCSLYRGACESHWHNVVDSGECLGVNGAAAAKEGPNIVTGCPWCVWWVNC